MISSLHALAAFLLLASAGCLSVSVSGIGSAGGTTATSTGGTGTTSGISTGGCETSAQCAAGFFCDTLDAACCSGLDAGGTIEVDSDRGDDALACCGIGKTKPCRTITQAMRLIDSAQARDLTIHAAVSSDGGIWAWDGGEAYPIALGWGAELSAPGVTFLVIEDAGLSTEIFDIGSYSASDTVGYASLTGTPALPVVVDTNQTAVQVEGGTHLYLANTVLRAVDGIHVQPLGRLTLGRDRTGSLAGTVVIGLTDPTGLFAGVGVDGISCFSDDAGNGCTIDDAALDGGSSVIIQNQRLADIHAETGASISLNSSPIIGVAPTPIGLWQCPSVEVEGFTGVTIPDLAAITLLGNSTMTFENGTLQCVAVPVAGFWLEALPAGSPSLTIRNSVIQNTEIGILAAGGSVTVANSAIRFNGIGVAAGGDAGIDLSGGSFGGRNTIACNFAGPSSVRGSVFNFSSNSINASNVAWDAPGPNVFTCSDAGVFSCAQADCTAVGDAGVLMDAISGPPYAGIVTTGNTLSPLQCE